MAEVLKRLTEARGVTGNEDEVREIILELARKTGAEVSVDRMGNVIAEKSGRAGTVSYTHLDVYKRQVPG